jgi:hypothetical protein
MHNCGVLGRRLYARKARRFYFSREKPSVWHYDVRSWDFLLAWSFGWVVERMNNLKNTLFESILFAVILAFLHFLFGFDFYGIAVAFFGFFFGQLYARCI